MFRACVVGAALLLVASCDRAPGPTSNATDPEAQNVEPNASDIGPSEEEAPDGGSEATDAAPLTVFTIVLENQDYADVVGSPNAPYINTLILNGALATNYTDSTVHPSLPNYLTLVSGAPQYKGGWDARPVDAPFPVEQPHLGTQLTAAAIPWRSYQESMGLPCQLKQSGMYVPRHDPFLYFADMRRDAAWCQSTQVDFDQNFETDLAAGTYRYLWITPNLMNDGHNPAKTPAQGLRQADAWLSAWVPKILASKSFQQNGVLFITWDEAEGRNGHSHYRIPMIVLSPKLKTTPLASATEWNHLSYLATVEDLFGLPRLPTVANTPNMLELFQK